MKQARRETQPPSSSGGILERQPYNHGFIYLALIPSSTADPAVQWLVAFLLSCRWNALFLALSAAVNSPVNVSHVSFTFPHFTFSNSAARQLPCHHQFCLSCPKRFAPVTLRWHNRSSIAPQRLVATRHLYAASDAVRRAPETYGLSRDTGTRLGNPTTVLFRFPCCCIEAQRALFRLVQGNWTL